MVANLEETKSSKLFKSFKSGDAIRSLSLRSSGNSCSQNTASSNTSTDFPQGQIMSAADVAKLVTDSYYSGEDGGDDAFNAQTEKMIVVLMIGTKRPPWVT